MQAFVPIWKKNGSMAAPFCNTRPASFALSNNRASRTLLVTTSSKNDNEGQDTLGDLSEERKSTLFQFILRDLQVEGVPLLAVDADQVHTMQAALWTTMAELAEQDDAQKACLIFEDIPMNALRTFVVDFCTLQSQDRLMGALPDLERYRISLLGKGVGPAILVETTPAVVSDETTPTAAGPVEIVRVNESTAAMKMFIDRVVVEQNVCPYAFNNQMAPTGLEDAGFPAAPIGYRVCTETEVCHVLSAFWNSVCEILVTPADQLSTTVLSMPAVRTHARFAAVSEMLSRSLCLFRGDSVLELLHFHPAYDRDNVHPIDIPAHGHLPPTQWLRPMLKYNGNTEAANRLSDQDLVAGSNYQRRSPVTAVCIKRVEMLQAGTDAANGIVDIVLEDQSTVQASGVPTYARNALGLAEQGAGALQEALDREIAIATSA
jgi:hypothetical protein